MLNYRSYPKNKTRYPFFGPPCTIYTQRKEAICRPHCRKRNDVITRQSTLKPYTACQDNTRGNINFTFSSISSRPAIKARGNSLISIWQSSASAWSSGWCRLVTLKLRFGSHCRSFASNLEQVANLLCAQAYSASYPPWDEKCVVGYGLRGVTNVTDWGGDVSVSWKPRATDGRIVRCGIILY